MDEFVGFFCLFAILIAIFFLIFFFYVQRELGNLRRQLAQLEATVVQYAPQTQAAPASTVAPALTALQEAEQLTTPAIAFSVAKPTSLPSSAAAVPVAMEKVGPAAQPPKPRWFEDNPLFDWFLRAHLMVQIGLVVLFIGLAFLLKFAVDQGWLSIEVRHLGVAVAAVTLGGIGWWLRRRRRTYGLALQGGALAILYLTTFSAYRLYELLPVPVAFGIFFALGVVGCILALLNDAPILAFLSTAGAFAAPLLTAGDEGSYLVLFGYYVLLNAGVLTIALFKAWYGLNLVSFAFTFGVGLLFTDANFEPADYAGFQVFVVVFFLFYVAIAVLFALRRRADRIANISVLLAFGTPLLTLVWQAILTDSIEKGLGYSALAGGIFYLALFAVILWHQTQALATLCEIFLFLALFLLTLSIPWFAESRVTAAIWAVTGAAWVWLGARRRSRWLPGWGGLVQLAAGALFAWDLVTEHGILFITTVFEGTFFLSPFFVGSALLGLAGMGSAYIMERTSRQVQRYGPTLHAYANLLLVWGLAWWFGGGVLQSLVTADGGYRVSGIVIFLALSCAVCEGAGGILRWPALHAPMWLLLPVLMLLALPQVVEVSHPLEGGAWYAWPLAFLVQYWMLWRRDGDPRLGFYHAGAFWLFSFLAVMATYWLTWDWEHNATLAAAMIMGVLALLIWGAVWMTPRLPRPIRTNARAYQLWGAGGLAGVGILYLTYANTFSDGDSFPIPYLPVLNAFSVATIGLLSATFFWLARTRSLVSPTWRTAFWSLRWVWGAVMFYCLSTGVARTVHQMAHVPFNFDALYASELLQAFLSIAWGGLALVLMFAARWRKSRSLWFAGALVLILTLVKLFLVDLATAGTIARIFSFIGVGLLIIVIAFFAPVPPRRLAAEQPDLNTADL